MNVDNVASRLSETDAAEFRAARLMWKLACDRVCGIREEELYRLVQIFKNGETSMNLADLLEGCGFHLSHLGGGVHRVWDSATYQSIQLTGV